MTLLLPSGVRIIDGLFQTLSVRCGEFYVVSIGQLRIGLLILYVILMYISVYRVVITMRNSNVSEERSLCIYANDDQEKSAEAKKSFLGGLKRSMTNRRGGTESRGYFVCQQLRGQLAHDLWWIVLAVLFIMITETGQFERDPITYSVSTSSSKSSPPTAALASALACQTLCIVQLLQWLARFEQIDPLCGHDSRAASGPTGRYRSSGAFTW